MTEAVNHPIHYGGEESPYEAIKVIEAWGLDFCLGNTVKYISRAGLKDPAKELEDLQKAGWYLNRRIQQITAAQAAIAERTKQSQPAPQLQVRPLIILAEEPQHEDISNGHETMGTGISTQEEPSQSG